MAKKKRARAAGSKDTKGVKIPLVRSEPVPYYLEYRTPRRFLVSAMPTKACAHANQVVCYVHSTATCHMTVCYPMTPLTGVPKPINCPGCGLQVNPTYIKCIICGVIL